MAPPWDLLIRPWNWLALFNCARRPAPKRLVRAALSTARRVRPTTPAKRPSLSKRPLWKRTDYIHKLEKLVSGFKAFEDIEGKRDAITARIRHYLAHQEDERISSLLQERRKAASALGDKREGLHSHADELLGALEERKFHKKPSLLPFYFVEQLKRCEAARKIWLEMRREGLEWEGKKAVAKLRLVLAEIKEGEFRYHQRGWRMGRGFLGELRGLVEGLEDEELIADAALRNMDEDMRRLCKQLTTMCSAYLTNVETGKDQAKLPGKSAGPKVQSDRKVPQDELEAIKRGWEDIQGTIHKAKATYRRKFPTFNALEDHYNESMAEARRKGQVWDQAHSDAFYRDWFKQSYYAFTTWRGRESQFEKLRSYAMQAGLEPVKADSELGEDWSHPEDDHLTSRAPENIALDIRNADHDAPLTIAWSDKVKATAQQQDSPPSGSNWGECSSVQLGETRSGEMFTTGR